MMNTKMSQFIATKNSKWSFYDHNKLKTVYSDIFMSNNVSRKSKI